MFIIIDGDLAKTKGFTPGEEDYDPCQCSCSDCCDEYVEDDVGTGVAAWGADGGDGDGGNLAASASVALDMYGPIQAVSAALASLEKILPEVMSVYNVKFSLTTSKSVTQ